MGGSWPAVKYEARPWVASYTPGEGSRRSQQKHRGPYQACVPPMIADQAVTLDASVLTAATDAATEIARFDTALGSEIAPFAAVLLRTESAASSQIENLSASARALAAAELGERTGTNAAEIVGNVHAMTAALELADQMSVEAICGMHHALLAETHPDIAGEVRTQQVWIQGGELGPHGAAFIPPHHDLVPAGLDDLVAFLDRTNIPVLVHAAIGHAQFETIHPFVDGNGRTGRAIVHSFLRHAALTRNVTVPISAGLLADTEGYFDALAQYRAGRLEPIVDAFTGAAYSAIANGTQLVDELRAIRASWRHKNLARSDSRVWAVTELLLRQPVVNAAYVAQQLDTDPDNVHRLLDPLIAAGVVVTAAGPRRGRTWRAPEVLDALDGFAQRSGRRRFGGANVGAWTPGLGDSPPDVSLPEVPHL